MSQKYITQVTAQTDALADGDLFLITDVSDTSERSDGTNKKLTFTQIKSGMDTAGYIKLTDISVTDSGGDGSLSYNNTTGVITYTGPSASEVRAHISVTDSGGDGSLSYSSSTGVITYTGPSASEVRAHLSVGTESSASGDGAIAYNSSTGVFTYTPPTPSGIGAITASSTDTLTNKTFDANGTGNSITNIETPDVASASKTGSDTKFVTGTEGTNGNLLQWNADGDAVDSSLATADVVTGSSTDTFTNKTFDANATGNSLSNVEVADLASSAKTGSDTKVVTGTAGTSGDLAQWNGDGDLVDGPTPPSGTIVGTSDSQALTNKTIDGDLNTLQDIAYSSIKSTSRTGSDEKLVTGTAGTSGDLSIWNADGDLVDGPTPPTGTIVGTSDSQTLTNKTIDANSNTITNIGASEVESGIINDQTESTNPISTDTVLVYTGSNLRKVQLDNLPSIYKLGELQDVTLQDDTDESDAVSDGGLNNGELLVYDAPNDIWINDDTLIVDHQSQLLKAGDLIYDNLPSAGNAKLYFEEVTNSNGKHFTIETSGISADDTDGSTGGNLILSTGNSQATTSSETTGSVQIVTGSASGSPAGTTGSITLQTGSVASGATGNITLRTGTSSGTDSAGNIVFDLGQDGDGFTYSDAIPETTKVFNFGTASNAWKGLYSNAAYFVETGLGSNYVAFTAPSSIASNITWTLPATDGSNGQVLSTNGSGTLSWATAGGSGDITAVNITTDSGAGSKASDTSGDADFSLLGGDGVSVTNSGATITVALADPDALDQGSDIDETVIATDDRLLIWDETASNWKYVTIDNLQDEIDTDTGIALTDLSVGSEAAASGDGAISYNNSTGVFTYTPPTAAGISAITASSTDTLTNKTFDANGTGNSLSNVETADIASGSKSGSDTTLVTGTAGTNGNLVSWNADGDAVDSSIVASNVALTDGDTYTGTHDFGGATLEIPNAAAPSLSTAGQIALDTTTTDHTALLKYHDGTNEFVIPAILSSGLSTTDNDVIAYNAANNRFEMEAQSGSGGSGISDVVDDTSPQLGGDLDVNGNSIVSVSNGDITLAPDGTGDVVISGNISVDDRLKGGIGAISTIGTLDFDDTSNSASGSGYTLLRGSTASNAPNSSTNFWYPFTFEYQSRNGTGSRTQFAIPYASTGGAQDDIYFRSHYSSTWYGWRKVLSEDTSGRVVVNGTSSLATTTIYGHDASDEAMVIQPHASATGSQVVFDLQTPGGGGTMLNVTADGDVQVAQSDLFIGDTTVNRYSETSGNGGTTIRRDSVSSILNSKNASSGFANVYLNIISPTSTWSDGGNRFLAFYYGDGSQYWNINGDSNKDLYVNSSGVGDLYVQNCDMYISDGGVLVNGSSQLGTLTVYGHDAADEALVVRAASSQTADILQVQDNSGTELVTVDSSGKVGINKSSPDGVLHVVSDSTSVAALTLESNEDTSAAAPIIDLCRISTTPADGDYLGQIKFKGESDTGAQRVYAKITGKTSDVSNTTEDGLLEIMVRRNGSNLITSRFTGTALKLINSTGLEVTGGDITTNVTASRAVVTDASSNLSASATTSTELGYVSGVTSAIQTQIDGKIGDVVDDTTPQLGGQLDVNGQAIGDGTRELLTFTEDASAVNHVNIENEATGSGPIISAAGDDTNIDLNISAKGTGNISLGNMTFDADQSIGSGQDNYVLTYDHSAGTISLEAASGGGGGISNVVEDTTPQLGGQLDVNGNAIGDGTRELLTFTEDASAVNHINIENEATGSGPIISAAGDDTNIDLNISAKGTGTILGGKTQLTNSSAAQLLVRGWGPDSTGNDGGAIQLGEESNFHGLVSYDNTSSVLFIDNAYNSNNGDIGFRTKTAGTAVTPLRLKGSGQTIINGTSALATATIYGHSASDETLVVRAASSQSADILQIQNSGGTELVTVDSSGKLGINSASPNATLTVNGSMSLPIESISATDTLDDSNHTVLVNASGGSRTVNLPAASGSTGKVFIIKKTDSSSNNVVIDPNASETIDGSSTFTFNAQYRAVTIQCDGSNWHIISSYIVNY